MDTPPFSVMLKPRGAICNLRCAYCYYLSKKDLYPTSDFRMPEALLDAFTRQYIAAQPGQEIVFSWQGGEPLLMGLDFFRTALALQEKYCPPGKLISNTIQTNAILIDDAWCQFFKQHEFLVGVSLDGPRLLHDAFRRDLGDNPSFQRTLQGLRRLQRHGVQVNVLTTVHAANGAYPLDVYHFLRDEIGTRFIQFIPIVERQGQRVTPRSVTGPLYGEFLIAVFDEWLKGDVGKVFVQIFDVALGIWLGFPAGLCIFAETCGGGPALEHNGDLYACDHFVTPDNLLGNIVQTPLRELATSPAQMAFGRAKRDRLPQACLSCPVRFACQGECPKNRFIYTSDGEPGLNYLCDGYKAFFSHIAEPMRRMASAISPPS